MKPSIIAIQTLSGIFYNYKIVHYSNNTFHFGGDSFFDEENYPTTDANNVLYKRFSYICTLHLYKEAKNWIESQWLKYASPLEKELYLYEIS